MNLFIYLSFVILWNSVNVSIHFGDKFSLCQFKHLIMNLDPEESDNEEGNSPTKAQAQSHVHTRTSGAADVHHTSAPAEDRVSEHHPPPAVSFTSKTTNNEYSECHTLYIGQIQVSRLFLVFKTWQLKYMLSLLSWFPTGRTISDETKSPSNFDYSRIQVWVHVNWTYQIRYAPETIQFKIPQGD